MELTNKLYDPLRQSAHLLRSGELSLRERLNVYGGMLLGLGLPILATRWLSYGFSLDTQNLGEEALKLASSLYPGGLFSIPGFFIGAALGNHSAKSLRERREEEEKEKERRDLGKILEI